MSATDSDDELESMPMARRSGHSIGFPSGSRCFGLASTSLPVRLQLASLALLIVVLLVQLMDKREILAALSSSAGHSRSDGKSSSAEGNTQLALNTAGIDRAGVVHAASKARLSTRPRMSSSCSLSLLLLLFCRRERLSVWLVCSFRVFRSC